MTPPLRGISQRALDALWEAAGGKILVIRRTGEGRYVHPATGHRSTPYNRRRKDASVKLVAFARKVLALDDAPLGTSGATVSRYAAFQESRRLVTAQSTGGAQRPLSSSQEPSQ